MRVLFNQAAIREFEAAVRWYTKQNPSAAVHFRNAVNETVETILERPRTFPEMAPGVQRALCRRFPYAVVFCLFPDTLYVVAVAHGKRKTQYWRRRVPTDL